MYFDLTFPWWEEFPDNIWMYIPDRIFLSILSYVHIFVHYTSFACYISFLFVTLK